MGRKKRRPAFGQSFPPEGYRERGRESGSLKIALITGIVVAVVGGAVTLVVSLAQKGITDGAAYTLYIENDPTKINYQYHGAGDFGPGGYVFPSVDDAPVPPADLGHEACRWNGDPLPGGRPVNTGRAQLNFSTGAVGIRIHGVRIVHREPPHPAESGVLLGCDPHGGVTRERYFINVRLDEDYVGTCLESKPDDGGLCDEGILFDVPANGHETLLLTTDSSALDNTWWLELYATVGREEKTLTIGADGYAEGPAVDSGVEPFHVLGGERPYYVLNDDATAWVPYTYG